MYIIFQDNFELLGDDQVSIGNDVNFDDEGKKHAVLLLPELPNKLPDGPAADGIKESIDQVEMNTFSVKFEAVCVSSLKWTLQGISGVFAAITISKSVLKQQGS